MPINKTISDKRKRQCAKLVELCKAVVREAFEKFKPEEIGIPGPAGKTAGWPLWCIRQVCLEKGISIPKTLIIGEGDEFEEIEAFVEKFTKEWKVPLDVRRNEDVLKAANHKLETIIKVKDLNERNQAEFKANRFQGPGIPL